MDRIDLNIDVVGVSQSPCNYNVVAIIQGVFSLCICEILDRISKSLRNTCHHGTTCGVMANINYISCAVSTIIIDNSLFS